MIPGWLSAKPRRIRVWSAGCSSGEEAFTVAMLLLSKLPLDRGFSVEVFGTDISGAALERARAACWPDARMREVPESFRRRFFDVDPRTGDHVPSTLLRSVVRFQKLNLCDVVQPVTGRFDLVLCRNVLMYFDAPTRSGVVRRLASRLTPQGLLLLGLSESLLAARDGSLEPRELHEPPSGERLPGTLATARLHVVGPAIYALDRRAHAGPHSFNASPQWARGQVPASPTPASPRSVPPPASPRSVPPPTSRSSHPPSHPPSSAPPSSDPPTTGARRSSRPPPPAEPFLSEGRARPPLR